MPQVLLPVLSHNAVNKGHYTAVSFNQLLLWSITFHAVDQISNK